MGAIEMKHTTLESLGNTASETGVIAKGPGAGTTGPGFIGQIQEGINTFKEVLSIMRELQGLRGQEPPAQDGEFKEIPPGPPQGSRFNPDLGNFLAKYGDMTIDQALNMLKPMTLKQFIGLVRGNARPRK